MSQTHNHLSLVPRAFQSKCWEEGSGDSGQDVVTQWNAIMGILCNCLLVMRADGTYPNCCRDRCRHFFSTKAIFFDLVAILTPYITLASSKDV